MKKLISIIVIVLLALIITMPSAEASTVSAGKCTEMSRDKIYSTRWFSTGNEGRAYVHVKNCENASGADGYTGVADMRVQSYYLKKNCVFKNDISMKKGVEKQYSGTGCGVAATSAVKWEKVDNQSTSGNKKIYASVD